MRYSGVPAMVRKRARDASLGMNLKGADRDRFSVSVELALHVCRFGLEVFGLHLFSLSFRQRAWIVLDVGPGRLEGDGDSARC